MVIEDGTPTMNVDEGIKLPGTIFFRYENAFTQVTTSPELSPRLGKTWSPS